MHTTPKEIESNRLCIRFGCFTVLLIARVIVLYFSSYTLNARLISEAVLPAYSAGLTRTRTRNV